MRRLLDWNIVSVKHVLFNINIYIHEQNIPYDEHSYIFSV